MKHFIFSVAVCLMFSTPAQADLEEKTWKTMSDDFQLGYLWGTLDTTVTRVWDRKSAGKTLNDELIYRAWRESVEKRMAECIRTEKLSPMNFQALLDKFIREEKPNPNDSIPEILRHILWHTCFGS